MPGLCQSALQLALRCDGVPKTMRRTPAVQVTVLPGGLHAASLTQFPAACNWLVRLFGGGGRNEPA